jgi:hypothetical protein
MVGWTTAGPSGTMAVATPHTGAAEDTAYVFFKVWKFPVDSPFYVTAAAFSGKKQWERGTPIR